MSEIRIPAVKLKPELVFGILEIIDKYTDNPRILKQKIISFYRSKSLRSKAPSPKNIVRAVTFPSLRHLDLIDGYWPNISINPNGKVLLKTYQLSGLSQAKRKFGFIFYKVDKRTGEVIDTLLRLAKKDEIMSLNTILSIKEKEFNIITPYSSS